MRHYEPVWIKLKKEKTVSITANYSLHKRIIKAVIKEKWMDLGYKLQLGNRSAYLSYTQSNSIITFHLKIIQSTVTSADL
jgi:hypothetical protein